MGGTPETAFGLHHDDQLPVLLHFTVISAGGPKQLGPANLEIDKVVGVVQKTHRIGFLIPHPQFNFVLSQHGRNFLGVGGFSRTPFREYSCR